MSEYGGLTGIWEDLKNNLIVDATTYQDDSSNPDLPLVTRFNVTNAASKVDSGLEVFFEEVVLTVGVPPNMHIEKHTNLAGGESFTYEHHSRYGDLGRIVFSVDGTVSPSRLLRVRRAVAEISPGTASLSIASYVDVLQDIDIKKWVRDTIKTMLIPGPDTTEADLNAQKNRFRNARKDIDGTRIQLEKISGFIVRTGDTDKTKMSRHIQLIEAYLSQISAACGELGKMLDIMNAKTLIANRDRIVTSLSNEASRVDEATKGLLSK